MSSSVVSTAVHLNLYNNSIRKSESKVGALKINGLWFCLKVNNVRTMHVGWVFLFHPPRMHCGGFRSSHYGCTITTMTTFRRRSVLSWVVLKCLCEGDKFQSQGDRVHTFVLQHTIYIIKRNIYCLHKQKCWPKFMSSNMPSTINSAMRVVRHDVYL